MKDILIIGSGPAGLTAGIYAKRAGLDAVIAEKDFLSAGAIMSSARVDNYPGLYGVSGYNLGDQMRQHAEALRVAFHTAEAIGIDKIDGGWMTSFHDGSSIDSRTIIYAVGTEAISLKLKGEKQFGRKGIHFCAVCDGPQYRGLTAAVVGGGDTAVDTARYLANICDKVHIIHRFAEFEANARSVESLKELDNVEIHLEAEIASVSGVSSIEKIHLTTGETIVTSCLFEAVGFRPRTELLAGIADMDKDGYTIAGEDTATSAAGIFAAGDVRTKKLRQVVTATADGANAVAYAADYINNSPGKTATVGKEDNMEMYKIGLLMFEKKGCPYCQMAKELIDELKAADSTFAKVPVIIVDEDEKPTISRRFTYYHVPSIFLGEQKLYEAAPGVNRHDMKENIRSCLAGAVKINDVANQGVLSTVSFRPSTAMMGMENDDNAMHKVGLLLFYKKDNSECTMAKRLVEELKADSPALARVPVILIDEEERYDIARRFTYDKAPAVFLGDRKMFEAPAGCPRDEMKEQLRKAMEAALEVTV